MVDVKTSNYAFFHMLKPVVYAVQPPLGPSTGGTTVYIHAHDLPTARKVFIRFQSSDVTQTAAIVEAVAVTKSILMCETPALSPGTASLSLSVDAANFLALGHDFTFYSPIFIGSFKPSSGSSDGGTVIVVSGSNFDASGIVYCRFGSTVVKGTVLNASAASCISPSLPGGKTVALEMSTNGVDFSSSKDFPGFSFVAAPTVRSVIPQSGVASGGTKILLHGSGFRSEDLFVCKFGDAVPSTGVRINASALECLTPSVDIGSNSRLRVPVQISINGGVDFLSCLQRKKTSCSGHDAEYEV